MRVYIVPVGNGEPFAGSPYPNRMAKGANGTQRAYGLAWAKEKAAVEGLQKPAIYESGPKADSTPRPYVRRMPEGLTEYEKKVWRKSLWLRQWRYTD